MAEFEVNVVKIDDVIEHPDADRLTIVKIGLYNCIANKHEDGSWRYQAGDLVVYIPEQAVVPEWLLKHMGFWKDESGKGMLAGSKGDRVKAIKLRGIFSQGILMPIVYEGTRNDGEVPTIETVESWIGVELGQDVAEELGIKKYEPVIPASMSGEVWNAGGKTINFDVENIQRYPDILAEPEEVSVTEKLHGTWCCYGIHVDKEGEKTTIVSSKGLSGRGLAFKFSEKNMASNLYLQVLERTRDVHDEDIVERLERYMKDNQISEPVYLLGEVFGRGVQDLAYGEMKPTFRLFDIYIGEPTQGRYMDVCDKNDLARELKIDTVPELYRGTFTMEKMEELRDGQDFSGSNIREGIVILPMVERRCDEIGRVQLKYVSPKYTLRKGGTELN